MEGDKCGVRITPSALEFYDAEVNIVHQLNVTVKNTSKTSKSIRYYGPKTKVCALSIAYFHSMTECTNTVGLCTDNKISTVYTLIQF